MEKVKIGVVGVGFGAHFLELFTLHPDVSKVVAADMNTERRKSVCSPLGVESYDTMDEMLEKNSDLNSVAIFAQRHIHGKLTIEALKKGLNVFSAVPIAVSEEEIREIISLVEKTRLTCMIAETCYYFPDAIFCRERFKRGDFGKFVYGEAGYYHDITDFENLAPFERGIPPMFYSTHSMSMLFSSIDDKPIDVCCFGSEDPLENAGIYGKGNNLWDNPFSNETAIFHMKKGGVACINEFRRLGKNKPSSMINCIRGTKASYDTAGRVAAMDYGNLPHLGQKADFEYVSDEIMTDKFKNDSKNRTLTHPITSYDYSQGFSACQPVERLPRAFRAWKHAAGHNGSHPFLADDFVRSVISHRLPLSNVWEAAACIIPGLIAHESALKGGVTLPIPDFGEPPSDWARLDYTERTYSDDEKPGILSAKE